MSNDDDDDVTTSADLEDCEQALARCQRHHDAREGARVSLGDELDATRQALTEATEEVTRLRALLDVRAHLAVMGDAQSRPHDPARCTCGHLVEDHRWGWNPLLRGTCPVGDCRCKKATERKVET